jgi:hypothetical protein
MTEWYYARGGQQNGPVSFEQLAELARTGGLNPMKDLVWTASMKDWLPAGQVPEIYGHAAAPANPYAAPQSDLNDVARITTGEALAEIVPGSEPIDVMACVKRGFDLTCRHFGMILLVGVVYMGVSFGTSLLLGLMDVALGLGQVPQTQFESEAGSAFASFQQNGSPLNMLISQVVSIFLSLGISRIGLNLVSGKEFSVGMLFGGGRKLLPALGATILYGLMVGLGMVLLIVPGIYLALRYGQYLTAMVDRDMGIMESFQYSSSLTTNNRMNLFLLVLLAVVIMFAGCLALVVGMIFAFPVVWLSWIVAYRWMQYGHRAALDHHGTKTPMLTGL